MQPTMTTRPVSPRIQALKVLIVDDEHYMRKVTRTILAAIGVRTILEAPDGMAGLELARTQLPHLLIIDWEMPVIDGAQLVRMIRTPGEFPAPDVPIIMLSAHSDHRRVVESARIGANVSETTHEMATDAVTVSANSRNRRPIIPPMSRSGMNTATSDKLIDSTVKPISREPLSAASKGGSPCSMWR